MTTIPPLFRSLSRPSHRLSRLRDGGLALMVAGAAAVAGCDASDPAPVATPAPLQVPAPDGLPNIVLITVESLRTDHFGAYGGKSPSKPDVPLTPFLDAFAAEAVVYDDAHSVTSWTLSSHASLFTGLYPVAHQTRRSTDLLDDSYQTLAERLRDKGYSTAGVISGPYLRKVHNLSQGYTHYHDEISSESNKKSHADTTNRRMVDTMRQVLEREVDPERPFLLFAYFWDPHYDYVPPEPYASMFVGADVEPIDVHGYESTSTVNDSISPAQLSYVLSQYDGEIRWTDKHLGEFFQFLKDRGVWDDTVIIVTSDHGEEFFDHGEKGHYNNVYAESVHVPLIVKYAGRSPAGHDDRLASLVDVMPTVLELAEVEAVETEDLLDGRSLLDPAPPADRAIYHDLLSVWRIAESREPSALARRFENWPLLPGVFAFWDYMLSSDEETGFKIRTQTWSGVRRGRHKLVESPELGRLELYDVVADPMEKKNLAGEDAETVAGLQADLEEWRIRQKETASRYREGGAAELTPQQKEELRSLGYL